MEHIDSMTRLRENVAFSGYAQKNPLTEYKSQGYEMFTELLDTIRNKTVNGLFKINLAKITPVQVVRKPAPETGKTNEGDIQKPLSGERSTTAVDPDADNPVIVRVKTNRDEGVAGGLGGKPEEKVGRNDPCPCGNGKKYKKCCGKGL